MKAFLSKLGQSFMLPIALLPAAGIMLGIGGSFTSPDMIAAYGLEGILGDGTPLNVILTILNNAGDIVFANLPLMFAIAVAIAFAKKDKGAAALAAVMSYLIMNVVLATTVDLGGFVQIAADGSETFVIFGITLQGFLTDVLGIHNTLNMGVFGGIIAGGVTAVLHNKYSDVKLPDTLGFFGGARFVPIISSFAAIFYGAALILVWPILGSIFGSIGYGLQYLVGHNLGWVASGIHGVIERSLIPMGLHHVYYVPLWQTSMGGSYLVDGTMVQGTQNAFFAALNTGDWSTFPSTNFMSGKFPFMMFGLPAMAYAMYSVADEENKKIAGGMLFSVALTSFLTGITEPIEFTFLFLAPRFFYTYYIALAGVSFALMDLLHVKVGMTFSGGFIDFVLFGIIPGISGVDNNWYYIIVVGIIFIPIYYFLFRWYILKHDIKTPGRGSEMKMLSKDDYKNSKNTSSSKDASSADYEMSLKLIEALGGADNIVSVDACITRLRVAVVDGKNVAEKEVFTGELGAMGVNSNGEAIQVIYGAQASVYKAIIEDILK